MSEKVLLTGISGYIGLHCAQQLLENGYSVVGSVRSHSKEAEVLRSLTNAGIDTENLGFVELDLTIDDGWDQALNGCDYLMHSASPFPIANPKYESEVIEPAVDGTLRALKAAKNNGIKRVVLTSSTVAIMGGKKQGTITPEQWTNLQAKNLSAYTKSKTLAEQAAWDFIKDNEVDKVPELVSINPGGVFGPAIGENLSGASMSMASQMLQGKVPMVPNVAFPMVDVRDVAKLHVAALKEEKAANQRFIATETTPRSLQEMGEILNMLGYTGPSTRVAPNIMLKFLSFFDREAAGMVGFLGMRISADNSKTKEVFNWEPIPFEQTLKDTASFIEGLITVKK
ncbi:MAG: 3 beta-hydroxysteroid dehydrogenase/Delta 5--_4-isomerase [Rhodothermaeota bacterium MED-G12]|nr:MAG: 3 beta-hydroxysteroid dehydrogenase/Delta 5-->4-isomerase [Rhodothermaeota bacterium MED-G12]